MAADISLAAPPPDLPAHGKQVAGALVAAVAVTVLAFCSFGLVLDLMVVVAVRAMGAPDVLIWTAGGLGAVAALCLSAWIGSLAWRQEMEMAAGR